MAPTRRALLAAAASGLALAAAAPALAQFARPAGGPGRYATVVVDVEALRAKGLGPFAELLRRDLETAMRAAFAGRVGGPVPEGRGRGAPLGPRLVVRITGLSLNAYGGNDSRPGSGGSGFGGGMNNDYLEGEALVVDRDGTVLLRHPQLSVTPASYGGPSYIEGSERRRLTVLAEHYAGWLSRAL